MASKYLASQLSGPLAQSVIGAQEYDYSLKDNALSYYQNISIDSALENDLTNIGLWIGMPWPTAPASLIAGNVFLFGTSSTFPHVNNSIGFGTTSNPSIGGLFTSLSANDSSYIPIDKYRALLKWFAWFKRNGFTIESIDRAANIFSTHYTINFVSFNTFTLAPDNVTTNNPLLGLAPDDLSTGGHFNSGGAWDINLKFTENVGAGNVYVLQYLFDKLLDTQRVNVSQTV